MIDRDHVGGGGPGTAEAVAHPNIALAKYWGKREDGDRLPAVPSVSVTLAGMRTRTRVTFDAALGEDELVLGGARAPVDATARVAALLDRVRAASGRRERARVESHNDFPTASGLASSASAFAALAAAATTAAGLVWPAARVSDLARRSSVSAARSVLGGYVELPAGRAGDVELAALPVAGPEHLALRIVVAVTREGPKDVGSTEGMLHTTRTSPFYPAWVAHAPALCARIRSAVLARDVEALGVAAEESALAMHASAIAAAPGLLYWTGATVEALAEVRRLRARGLAAWATIDAGPHVKVITTPGDEDAVTRAVSEVPGVLRTIATRPGPGATLVASSEA
jgi:diphosphomevalonate decarboxylase